MEAGVKRLSELNLGLAALLLLFVILAGPTLDILRRFVLNIGACATYLPELSNPLGARTTTSGMAGRPSIALGGSARSLRGHVHSVVQAP